MQPLLSEGEGNTPSMTKIRKLKGKYLKKKTFKKELNKG